MSNHWRKLDHIAFLLMFPFLLFMTWYPALLYPTNGDYAFLIISCCGMAAFFLWLIALIYDLKEHERNGIH
jgi:hypothetical protein